MNEPVSIAYLKPTIAKSRPVALVTGGARNIGHAIANRLHDDGFEIVVTIYEGDPLGGPGAPSRTTMDAGRDLGEKQDWDVLTGDLGDLGACEHLVNLVTERYGRLDCLIHNAATWTYGPALEVSDFDWRRVFDVDVLALVRLTRSAYPFLKRAPAPRVVAIGSIAAEWAGNGVGPYNVAKAGLNSLVRTLAVELAPDQILVNAVAPGLIETSTNGHELTDPDMTERHLLLIPMRRSGQPDEVARAVSFLASPELGFVTGSVLRIDGGQLAGTTSHFFDLTKDIGWQGKEKQYP
jgi:meso-butanediol dehydrogenase / (S,S)-butanediol dehydrogenase / diacetyl reductase